MINNAIIGTNVWIGKHHSELTKNKIKQKQTGSMNSQYGTCWMTREDKNIKVKKDRIAEYTKLGFTQGRKLSG